MTFTTAWLDSIDPSTQSEEWQAKRHAYRRLAASDVVGRTYGDVNEALRQLTELQSWLQENKR